MTIAVSQNSNAKIFAGESEYNNKKELIQRICVFESSKMTEDEFGKRRKKKRKRHTNMRNRLYKVLDGNKSI